MGVKNVPQSMSLLDYLNPRRYIDPYNTYSNPFKRTQQVTEASPVQPSISVQPNVPVAQAPEANKGFKMGDLTDYIPNIFGRTAPTTYDNLQALGLLTPQQVAQQQKTANIQGLLGAGLALAQGMSKIGPRRSAAENILGALAGGFGASAGAYQQGIQNIVQQQQLQSAALQQQQGASKLKSIANAKARYPDLAPLFDIDAGKAMEQVMLRERAKMYGFGSAPTQALDQLPTQVSTQAQPSEQVQQTQQLVDSQNAVKAAENRRKAALAMSLGDTNTAKFFQDEADRLDPREQLFFRDGKLVSTKRGLVGDFDVTREKFTGEYANLANTMFGTSDVSKLTQEQRKQVDAEAERRGMSKAREGAPKVYTGQLSKTAAGDVEKSVITTADAVTRLNSIQFSYKPQYQNIGFRTKQAWNTLRDKFGDLPDVDKKQLAEYSQYRQNALQNLNQTIKDITGAAMSDSEAKRITATLPDPGQDILGGDSPTEFESKLNNGIKQTKYALARKNYALKKGLNWETTPLDKMPSIINERGAAIAKQYNLNPKNPTDLQTINRQLAAEFGVSF